MRYGADMTPMRRIRQTGLDAFPTRTERWQQAGLADAIQTADAKRARRKALVFVLLIAGVLTLFALRQDLFPDLAKASRYVTAILLIGLGWGLAGTLAMGVAPQLFRRMDPATAGTVGFLFRLVTVVVVVIVSLRIAGVKPETLALGGAFTAVILGLAAQQTIGNMIAGTVLLSTRPFRVGERVRFKGGPVGDGVEGIVASLGLFYTTVLTGGQRVLIPNAVLMQAMVTPLRGGEAVELVARFPATTTPAAVEALLAEKINVELRGRPDVQLEEIDAGAGVVTFSISALPANPADGAVLAAEILEVARMTEPVSSGG